MRKCITYSSHQIGVNAVCRATDNKIYTNTEYAIIYRILLPCCCSHQTHIYFELVPSAVVWLSPYKQNALQKKKKHIATECEPNYMAIFLIKIYCLIAVVDVESMEKAENAAIARFIGLFEIGFSIRSMQNKSAKNMGGWSCRKTINFFIYGPPSPFANDKRRRNEIHSFDCMRSVSAYV